jgi:hypothetical protein
VCLVTRLRPGLRRDGVLITERSQRFMSFWGPNVTGAHSPGVRRTENSVDLSPVSIAQ